MDLPDVSVVMPVYNAGQFLDQAIKSICSQTFERFEFIIINDGSSDNSLDVIRRRQIEDKRIILINQPNGGIVSALNKGLAVASAEFVARMDGDDISYPHRLERQVAYLRANADVLLVGSSIRIVPLGEPPVGVNRVLIEQKAIITELLKGVGGAICHPTIMVRRDALGAVGGYRKECELAEDLDLYLRISKIGRITNIPELMLDYRVHPCSTNATRGEEQRKVVMKILEEAHRDRGLEFDPTKMPVPIKPSRGAGLLTWRYIALHDNNFLTALYYWAKGLRYRDGRSGSIKFPLIVFRDALRCALRISILNLGMHK